MSKSIVSFEADDGKGRAEIKFDCTKSSYFIELYDDQGHMFYTLDDFHGKALGYVEDAAINWCNGILKLETG